MRDLTVRRLPGRLSSPKADTMFGRVEIIADVAKVSRSLTAAFRPFCQTISHVEAFTPKADLAIVTTLLAKNRSSLDLHWDVFHHVQKAQSGGLKTLVILQDTGGTFSAGPSDGWAGGGLGLARTVRREWPDLNVRLIDVALSDLRAKSAAEAVLNALGREELELGISAEGHLYAPVLGEPLRELAGGKLPEGGHWLVTGGARGVTADCAIALARRIGGVFTLLGRTKPVDWPAGLAHQSTLTETRSWLIERAQKAGQKISLPEIDREARRIKAAGEIRMTLDAINDAGGRAHYLRADLADRDALHAAFVENQRRDGPITGLIHGAGVLADRAIEDKTRADFETVFGPKVKGLEEVLRLLDLSTLSHVALFSSAAARFGNKGQVDYAMANEVLNRVAQGLAKKMPRARVRSFNWGPWDGGMVDESLAAHFKRQGIGLIPRAAGAGIFADQLLGGEPGARELLIGDTWAQ